MQGMYGKLCKKMAKKSETNAVGHKERWELQTQEASKPYDFETNQMTNDAAAYSVMLNAASSHCFDGGDGGANGASVFGGGF